MSLAKYFSNLVIWQKLSGQLNWYAAIKIDCFVLLNLNFDKSADLNDLWVKAWARLMRADSRQDTNALGLKLCTQFVNICII